jgi:hypothetical protein
MKSILTTTLAMSLIIGLLAQPNGNGNGNGGTGNNGNGNGGCGNPPCGGPNSVPIETEWLVFAGLLVGCYIKFLKSRQPKV